MNINLSDLHAVDRLYCAVTGATPTDSARELKTRAKAVSKLLALAEAAGCRPDAPTSEVVTKLREMARKGGLRRV